MAASGIKHSETGAGLSKTEMEGAALHEITTDLDVDTHKVINVVDPTADQDGATKKYVDDSIHDVSRARAYRSGAQALAHNTMAKIALNTETFDNKSEFNSRAITGTADATEANKLHDADGGFEASDVGATIWNKTDDTYTTVSAFVDSGELTLTDDIMVDTETYELYHGRFTAAETGYYQVNAAILWQDMADAKKSQIYLRRNGTTVAEANIITGAAQWPSNVISDVIYLTAGQYVELWGEHEHGAARNAYGGATMTFMSIHRLS